MKRFDLEAAKAGAPVITRDGRKARIICFDRESSNEYCIIALIKEPGYDHENYNSYTKEGMLDSNSSGHPSDLFMAPQKKEYWVNVYRDTDGEILTGTIFISKRDCDEEIISLKLVATVKIFEEEV